MVLIEKIRGKPYLIYKKNFKDMTVKKTNGSYEEFDKEKVKSGICKAYETAKEKCDDFILESIANNLYLYENISTSEIRRQVEDALMSINKKVARTYSANYEEKLPMIKKQDFIKSYIEASNAATGSKFDSNANVSNKNIVTLGQELYKENNIKQNRYILCDKIKKMFSKKLSEQYLKDLESHVLYKHDESGTPGYPYTYSSKEVVEVLYNSKNLLLPMDMLYDLVDEEEILVDDKNIVYQKHPWNLFVKDKDNKYTKVTTVTKKKRHRDLVRIKTAFGEDIVVTDNHPMIIDRDNIENTVSAIDSLGNQQFKVDTRLTFKGKTKIDLVKILPSWISYGENWIKIHGVLSPMKRYVDIDEKLGYIIGFFIGDGNFDNTSHSLHFTQKDKSVLETINNYFFEVFNVIGKVSRDGKTEKHILDINNIFLFELFRNYFKIQDKAWNKTLPYNILEFNEDFALGILGGIVDSEGTILTGGYGYSIRLSSRACIMGCTALFRHFGYAVGNEMQSLPFSNNTSYKTNYTIWGVSANLRASSKPIKLSFKEKDTVINDTSRYKYKTDGEASITNVQVIESESAFLSLNEYIYDITTETHTFELNNLLVHNCVAITMFPFLENGLSKIGGVSTPPTDLKSYCGEFINLIYSVSSQFMGACASPEFLLYMDYFIRKDYGDNYIDRLNEVVDLSVKQRTLEKVIDNCFQQVVHSMNMPAGNRGYQTVFWNIGYFDKPYFEGVFGEFKFPDGSVPKWETLSWLQKHFMKWFNKEREKYVLTFPVETMALLTDGKDDFLDKEYADFTAEMWSEGHSFFCYLSDNPDALSSCCRLRSSLKELDAEDTDHNHTTHQYSMGTASVSTGSKSVMTMNLPRLIQNAARKYFENKGIILENGKNLIEQGLKYDKDELYEYIRNEVRDLTERVHKYQSAFNEIIKDYYKANMLTVYSAGFIDMRRQYLTVGVNGITDAAEFLGLKANVNGEYEEFVNNILETINISNRKDRTRDCMFNTEFVPAENLAVKNYKWDKKDGYWVSPNRNLYSSYFYNPEDTSLSVIDKMKLHGREFVKYLDGGSALHQNDANVHTKEQYRELLKIAAKNGCNYFTFNVKNTVCNNCGHISKHTFDKCPKCGSENVDYLTRVIGYLVRVKSMSEPRQEETGRRYYAE